MATIILSYRREDTELMVGRICDRLRDHYGRDSVMMDIDSIPYGLDFRKHIREAQSRCDLMVAIMGPRWAALNEQGQSRLADDTDWIRIEIEAALAKDVPVIPVLVNGAAMPKTRELPETMQDLAFRQAAPLDMRRDFHTHMDRLIGVMDELLKLKPGAEQGTAEQEATDEPEHRPAVRTTTQPSSPQPEAGAAKADARKAQEGSAKTPRARSSKSAEPAHEPTVAPGGSLLQRIFVAEAERRDAQSAILASNWWMVACRGVLALALGLVWLLGDTGSLNSLDTAILVPLYMGGLLIFLLLDGTLAIASGWRGARPNERFVPLILNGVVELLLGAWVALQRLGMVRVPADTAPWPPPEFWMDIGIGFMVASAMLLAAAPGLNMRYGRLWLIAAGVTFAAAAYFIMLSSSSGEYAWVGDSLTSVVGAFLLVLALQLLARDKEQAGRA
jgi:uncharacterized membrane protein HdeD (DUF308 family)